MCYLIISTYEILTLPLLIHLQIRFKLLMVNNNSISFTLKMFVALNYYDIQQLMAANILK